MKNLTIYSFYLSLLWAVAADRSLSASIKENHPDSPLEFDPEDMASSSYDEHSSARFESSDSYDAENKILSNISKAALFDSEDMESDSSDVEDKISSILSESWLDEYLDSEDFDDDNDIRSERTP